MKEYHYMKCCINFLSILVLSLFTLTSLSFSQYKWTDFNTNINTTDFEVLNDAIDRGSVIHHKLAQNKSSITGYKGVFFNKVKLLEFPTINSSFSGLASRIRAGQISIYPHIYTTSNGSATFALATMYNVSHVDPVRGMRTRPSISPETVSKIENESLIFSKLKFLVNDATIEINLQTNLQETNLLWDDYEVTYNYWLKSIVSTADIDNLLKIFNMPLTTLTIRAYTDKGHLDTTLEGKQLDNLRTAMIQTITLYKSMAPPPPPPTPAPKATAVRAPVKKAPVKKAPVKKQAPATRTVNTNARPKTTRVVKPS